MVLPFWYQLTQVVLEKRLLNGCLRFWLHRLSLSPSVSEQVLNISALRHTVHYTVCSPSVKCCHQLVDGGRQRQDQFVLHKEPWQHDDVTLPACSDHSPSHTASAAMYSASSTTRRIGHIPACLSLRSITCIFNTTTHHNRFTALGPPGWAGARRELLDFMMQGKINRGRQTNHPAGRHSIRTNQCPPPPSSQYFFTGQMPFLPSNQQRQSTEGN